MPARHILASTTVSLAPHGKLAKSPFEAKSPYNPIKVAEPLLPEDCPWGERLPQKSPTLPASVRSQAMIVGMTRG